MSWLRGQAHWTQTLVFLLSRVWARVLVLTLVSLSKTLKHYCFGFQLGLKAVGSVCCVMQVKEPSYTIAKRRVLPRCFWQWLLSAPQHFANPFTYMSLIIQNIALLIPLTNK